VLAFAACYWLSEMRHEAEVCRGRTDDEGAWIVRQMEDEKEQEGMLEGCVRK